MNLQVIVVVSKLSSCSMSLTYCVRNRSSNPVTIANAFFMGLDQVVEHSLILVLEESVKNLMFKRFQGGFIIKIIIRVKKFKYRVCTKHFQCMKNFQYI